MTIEESSVVAAASNAAKFWMERGGFKAEVLSTTKVGQVHFMFHGAFSELEALFNNIKPQLFEANESHHQKHGGARRWYFRYRISGQNSQDFQGTTNFKSRLRRWMLWVPISSIHV